MIDDVVKFARAMRLACFSLIGYSPGGMAGYFISLVREFLQVDQ